MKSKIDLSHIDTIEDLKKEQLAVRLRVRMQEEQLKDHFKRLPTEALKAGASAVVPQFLQGKASTSILSAGTNIVSSLFAKSGTKGDVLFKGVRQAGMFFLIRQAIKFFAKKI